MRTVLMCASGLLLGYANGPIPTADQEQTSSRNENAPRQCYLDTITVALLTGEIEAGTPAEIVTVHAPDCRVIRHGVYTIFDNHDGFCGVRVIAKHDRVVQAIEFSGNSSSVLFSALTEQDESELNTGLLKVLAEYYDKLAPPRAKP